LQFIFCFLLIIDFLTLLQLLLFTLLKYMHLAIFFHDLFLHNYAYLLSVNGTLMDFN